MSGCLTHMHKSRSFIKSAGGVHFQHLEFDRQMRLVRFIQKLPDELRSDPVVLLSWRDFDRGKKNLMASASDRAPLPSFIPTPGLVNYARMVSQ